MFEMISATARCTPEQDLDRIVYQRGVNTGNRVLAIILLTQLFLLLRCLFLRKDDACFPLLMTRLAGVKPRCRRVSLLGDANARATLENEVFRADFRHLMVPRAPVAQTHLMKGITAALAVN